MRQHGFLLHAHQHDLALSTASWSWGIHGCAVWFWLRRFLSQGTHVQKAQMCRHDHIAIVVKALTSARPSVTTTLRRFRMQAIKSSVISIDTYLVADLFRFYPFTRMEQHSSSQGIMEFSGIAHVTHTSKGPVSSQCERHERTGLN
jgi:hypothetical protein